MTQVNELLKTNPQDFFKALGSSYEAEQESRRKPQPGQKYLAEPNTTQTPNNWYDFILPGLIANEETDVIAVVAYAIRHTYGYGKKIGDFISEEQFLNGTVTKGGKRVDWGCGIGMNENLSKEAKRSRLRRALAKAEKWQLLDIKRGLKIRTNDRYSTNFYRAAVESNDQV